MNNKRTPQEIALKNKLDEAHINVQEQYDDGFKHVDLYLPDSKIYIEIDGPKHLNDATQLVRDLKRDYYSHKDGYDTVHIPNDVIDKDLGGVASALAEASEIKREWLNLRN